MKTEVFIICTLIAGVKLVPVPDADAELLVDERYGGVPDHINGMALERDGEFNEVSHICALASIYYIVSHLFKVV